MKMQYSETLENIVAIANAAGYMESSGKIYIDDDTILTLFILDLINAWQGDEVNGQNFLEYAVEAIEEKFKPEES